MDPQQNTPNTQAPTGTTQAAPIAEHHSSAIGSIIGAIIVIIVIVIGGLYFWGAQLERQQAMTEELPFLLGDEGYENEGLPPTSSSDEVADIEADVSATDLEAFEAALDSDMANMDAATQ